MADLSAVFAAGAEEVTVRVSQYGGPDLHDPERHQSVIRHRHRDKVWGVGVSENAERALEIACDDFLHHHAPAATGRLDIEDIL